VHLTQTGQIAWDCWLALPGHFDGVTVDVFVIMPDHVHGILVIGGEAGEPAVAARASMIGSRRASDVVGAQHVAPLRASSTQPNGPKSQPNGGAASGADVGATHASMVGDRRALEMVGAQHAAPLQCPAAAPNHPRGNGPYPGSLGTIIRSYKSAVTRHINLMRKTSGTHVWQRNYFERIIRTQPDLDCARWYIRTNPDRW
jgi:REP element-mobilizing transposase RayT